MPPTSERRFRMSCSCHTDHFSDHPDLASAVAHAVRANEAMASINRENPWLQMPCVFVAFELQPDDDTTEPDWRTDYESRLEKLIQKLAEAGRLFN